MLNTVPCFFVDKVEKCNSYVSVRTLTTKNITSTFIVVCFSLNMLFLSEYGIVTSLTRKFMNHTYLVEVYTLNTQRTPYFFLYNRWNFNCTFFLTFVPLNMFRGALFGVYFPFNMLFMLFFAVQLVNALATGILFSFNVKKHDS